MQKTIRKEIWPGVWLRVISTNKFIAPCFSISFLTTLEKEKATYFALLPSFTQARVQKISGYGKARVRIKRALRREDRTLCPQKGRRAVRRVCLRHDQRQSGGKTNPFLKRPFRFFPKSFCARIPRTARLAKTTSREKGTTWSTGSRRRSTTSAFTRRKRLFEIMWRGRALRPFRVRRYRDGEDDHAGVGL